MMSKKALPYPIKLCYITRHKDNIPCFFEELFDYLKQRGVQITVITSPEDPCPALLKKNTEPRHFTFPIHRHLSFFADSALSIALYHHFREQAYDIVHTHTTKLNFIASLAAFMAGIPRIYSTIHGAYFHRYGHPKWNKTLQRLYSLLFYLNDRLLFINSEDYLVARHISRQARAKSIFMQGGVGVNLARFIPLGKASRQRLKQKYFSAAKFVVGFVGRIVGHKGIGDFLTLAQSFANNPDLQFLVVYNVIEDLSLLKTILAKGNLKNTIFWNRPNNLPELYQTMDLLVLPSCFEGLPVCLMEGAASGLPLLAYDIPGTRDIIIDSDNGFLVSPGNIAALKAKVSQLAGNPDLCERMGKQGRRLAEMKFDRNPVIKKMAQLYGIDSTPPKFNKILKKLDSGFRRNDDNLPEL